MDKKLKVLLLLGGTSPEREVSKSTGKSVYDALINLGYEVVVIDPAYGINQPFEVEDYFKETDYTEILNENYLDAVNLISSDQIDVAFLALHGKYGEDGTIQSLLELKGIKYTGSKVLSSAIAMDKIMSKILFEEYQVPTPEYFHFKIGEYTTEEIDTKIKNQFGYPAVVKPNDQGSTVGLTICKSSDQLEEAIHNAFEYSDRILVEDYIPGRELTVAVIDDQALPVLEIRPKHGIYDYECKYTSGMSEYIVPAEIPYEVAKELQEIAVRSCKSLRCEVYARVDFRLSPENKVYSLEVNTLPGMTSLSLVPKMAKAVGISFEQLVDKIINLSLK
ncbi:MAG: D-alanine--D-alanine ligase [Ignavibacterium sp.]|jgi:D-alanine-D-alanine ligase|nr:D-alanine--D-alanine ligase [Ignavibacterium sp.]